MVTNPRYTAITTQAMKSKIKAQECEYKKQSSPSIVYSASNWLTMLHTLCFRDLFASLSACSWKFKIERNKRSFDGIAYKWRKSFKKLSYLSLKICELIQHVLGLRARIVISSKWITSDSLYHLPLRLFTLSRLNYHYILYVLVN